MSLYTTNSPGVVEGHPLGRWVGGVARVLDAGHQGQAKEEHTKQQQARFPEQHFLQDKYLFSN